MSERAKQDPLIRELKKTAPWCGVVGCFGMFWGLSLVVTLEVLVEGADLCF